MPIRLAVSNRSHGPELNKIIAMYPQEKICQVLEEFIQNTGL